MHRTPNRPDYLHKPDDREEQPTIKKPQSLVANEQPLSENAPQKLRTPIGPRQPDNDRNEGRKNIGRRNLSPNNLAARSVGNRRAQIGSQRAQPTPALTNYLNHLGEEHENQERDAPAEPQLTDGDQNEGNAGRRNMPPNHLTGRSIGNRRARVGAQPTPALANYLNHLGEKHENQERDAPGVPQAIDSDQKEGHAYAGQGNAASPDEPVSLPVDASSARVEQPSHPTKPRWISWLSWFAAHSKRPDSSSHSGITLGIWGYYFAAKLALLWMNLISFHPLENLALAVFILFSSASQRLRRIRNTLIALSALALLYYDSWLPPIARVIDRAPSLADFKLIYLLELTTRFISLPVIAILLGVCLVYWIVSHRLRSGALVIACLAALSLLEYPLPNWTTNPSDPLEQTASTDKPGMDQVAQTFFSDEAQRSVSLPMPQADAAPFDVIFIQVCSLSWDDLHYAGLDQHPLWQRFDILLTKFNSATSYSGPAAIRLLRATCGQQEHSSMYSTTHDHCYLLNSLNNNGYETTFAMNHDGKFDDLLGQIKSYGQVTAPPLPTHGLEITQRSFNNSPVYDDLMVLNRWLETRQQSASPRVALYYHTGSLHDGNFLQGTESLPNTLQTYRKRLLTFLDEMEAFMQSLEQSGRRAVVFMVPEHGGAVRGDARQISGLREIPTPAITLVPVGIKVTGGNVQRKGDTLLIDQATSYLAISHIVARMLENSPYTSNTYAPSDYVADLPSTRFIAQTENAMVIEENGRFHLKIGSQSWSDYTEFNISTNR
jgi:cellulose synthase operon protein YhjU